MSLKKLAGHLLRRCGYEAVRSEFVLEFGLALHLKDLLGSQNIDTVWDVGANRGQFYRLLREDVGFKGTILSFEPLSDLHGMLEERSRTDPKWHVFPFALGEREEQRTINVMKANDLSSFLQPDVTHTDRFHDSNSIVTRTPVAIKRLDDVFEDVSGRFHPRRSYLKIDTQGYDLEVVRGGLKALPTFIGLQTEASVLPMYRGMPDYRETIRFLNDLGFELSGVYPVAKDQKLRLIEFDCVMVNADRVEPLTFPRY